MHLVRSEPPRYQAYLLRFWETRSLCPGRPSTWRFSLEDPQTGRMRAFTDLGALVTFLQAVLDGAREMPGRVSCRDETSAPTHVSIIPQLEESAHE
jgi:hypothetical protein